jgi:predicted nucleic acid-binding protein
VLAVIDTGVFVSGVFWRSEPHKVFCAWKAGILTPVISEPILDEYERVLKEVKQEEGMATDISTWLKTLEVAAVSRPPAPLGPMATSR